jgi:hypothetical protein
MSPPFSPTVVIARSELVGAFQQHLGGDPTVIVMDGADGPRLLGTGERAPQVVAVDPSVIGTGLGKWVLGELRDGGEFLKTEFRVLATDVTGVPILLRKPIEHGARLAIAGASQPLPRGHLRRVPRHPMEDGLHALVNGTSTALVDLSVLGAQVISPAVLRPNERVLMRILVEADGDVRMKGAIAWSMFELPPDARSPRYRAGLEFTTADATRLEAYCAEHRRRYPGPAY